MEAFRPERRFDWPIASFLVGYHVALLIGLPFYFAHNKPGAGLIAASVALLFLSEIGIGAAYHRYYAHRCYKLHPAAETVLLFLATLAFQGSALKWSHDHRKHHAHLDTEQDPYSITKGFFHAHVGWLFWKAPPFEPSRVRDLLKNPRVRFQDRWFGPLGVGANALVFALVGLATGEWLGSFVLAWWTRLMISHHLTWFINSLAHTWGSRLYSRELTAVDNFAIAILTVGEGYHNYHHTFPSDYRNGVRWYHFDPTKWTIWTLSRLGLASDLRRYSRAVIARRLVDEDRKVVLDAASRFASDLRETIERNIQSASDAVQAKIRRVAEAAAELDRLRRERAPKRSRKRQRLELRTRLRDARHELREWGRLCRKVLDGEVVTA